MERIGKYLVKELPVRTGYSEVFAARDPDLGVNVAIKVFRPNPEMSRDRVYDPAFWRARFLVEARILASLDHPNIIAVKELAIPQGERPYFVTPFMEANLIYEIGRDILADKDGTPTPEQKRPRAIAPPRAMQILRQVLSAAAAIHKIGVVHRDIKPGNILLTSKQGGTVKLCDFGMLKAPDTAGSRHGKWVGTLDYMAPEQRRNASGVDARADVYAIGAVAYRMLTGKLPVGAFPAVAETVRVPAGLSALIMQAVSRDEVERPKDGADMLRRLESVTTAPSPGPRKRARPMAPRRPTTRAS